MRRHILDVTQRRLFSGGPKPNLGPDAFPSYSKEFKPSKINYNRLNYVKQTVALPFTRKSNKTFEMRQLEKVRVTEMNKIKEEATASNAELALKIAVIVTRSPVILPDLNKSEISFFKLQEEQSQYNFKEYPTDILRMNVKHNPSAEASQEKPLPTGLEPWVYKSLSKETEVLGPYSFMPNLIERLKALETDTKIETKEEIGLNDAEEEELSISEDGWFEEEDTKNTASILDEYDLEMELKSSKLAGDREFRPASRISKDDEEDNVKSLYRKYKIPLYLVVKTDKGWRFPELDYNSIVTDMTEEDRSSLRVVAETGMSQLTEDNCELYFIGNAPAGFINERDPKFKLGDDIFGSSIFFYRAQYLDDIFHEISFDFSSLVGKNGILDYAWIGHDHLKNFLNSETIDSEYWKYAKFFVEK